MQNSSGRAFCQACKHSEHITPRTQQREKLSPNGPSGTEVLPASSPKCLSVAVFVNPESMCGSIFGSAFTRVLCGDCTAVPCFPTKYRSSESRNILSNNRNCSLGCPTIREGWRISSERQPGLVKTRSRFARYERGSKDKSGEENRCRTSSTK